MSFPHTSSVPRMCCGRITNLSEFRVWERPLTYLAGPYSHKDHAVREARYIHLTRATAWLIKRYKWNVFSPITHSHPIHTIGGIESDWKTWKIFDEQYIRLSCRLIVLCLPGWRESVGVEAEQKIAQFNRLSVIYMTASDEVVEDYKLSPDAPCVENLTEVLSKP